MCCLLTPRAHNAFFCVLRQGTQLLPREKKYTGTRVLPRISPPLSVDPHPPYAYNKVTQSTCIIPHDKIPDEKPDDGIRTFRNTSNNTHGVGNHEKITYNLFISARHWQQLSSRRRKGGVDSTYGPQTNAHKKSTKLAAPPPRLLPVASELPPPPPYPSPGEPRIKKQEPPKKNNKNQKKSMYYVKRPCYERVYTRPTFNAARSNWGQPTTIIIMPSQP